VGVEADEVEPSAHLVGVEKRPGEEREIDSRTARPPGVEEQRAEPTLGSVAGSRTRAIEIVAPFGSS
jgi:hypothetical protein